MPGRARWGALERGAGHKLGHDTIRCAVQVECSCGLGGCGADPRRLDQGLEAH